MRQLLLCSQVDRNGEHLLFHAAVTFTHTLELFVCLPPHRYHKLVWGPLGLDTQGHLSTVLITGGENGNIILYDPAKIVVGESDDVIIAESDRHTGPVRALDINPFQVRPTQNWLIKVF